MLCLKARPVPELTWRASPQHASPLRTHPCRHRVLLCAQQACSVCEACARPTSPRLATRRLILGGFLGVAWQIRFRTTLVCQRKTLVFQFCLLSNDQKTASNLIYCQCLSGLLLFL